MVKTENRDQRSGVSFWLAASQYHAPDAFTALHFKRQRFSALCPLISVL
jgi:hypothetical protein